MKIYRLVFSLIYKLCEYVYCGIIIVSFLFENLDTGTSIKNIAALKAFVRLYLLHKKCLTTTVDLLNLFVITELRQNPVGC